jgi:hypothetical protein
MTSYNVKGCPRCDAVRRILAVVVIYRNPLDYPGKYVVRRQWAGAGGSIEVEDEPIAVVDTLDEARAAVPAEQDACIARDPHDEPHIVESWI